MKAWMILALAAVAGAVYFVTRGSGKAGVQGNNSRFTSTGTAGPPRFFGLGGAPQLIVETLKPGSNAAAWASVGTRSVNALADLAERYWRPNRKVEAQGAGRADSPIGGTNYSTWGDYYQAQSDAAGAATHPNNLTSEFEADVPEFDPDFQENVI